MFWYTPKLLRTPFDNDVPDERTIVRYLDAFKFRWMIKASKLYMPREEALRDPFTAALGCAKPATLAFAKRSTCRLW